MNKCPRCENENLVENQKFCQICGLKLEDLNISKEEATKLLRELSKSLKTKITPNHLLEKEYRKFIRALELGVEALEKDVTNSISKEKAKSRSIIDFATGKFKSIRLYNKKEDFEEAYLKANRKLGFILTPELLKFNHITSIDEIFMLGFLEDEEE